MYSEQAPANVSLNGIIHWETIALIIFAVLIALAVIVALSVLFLEAVTSRKKNQSPTNAPAAKKMHWFFKFLIALPICCVVVIAGINAVEFVTNKTNPDGAKSIFRRSADYKDVIIEHGYEFDISDNYEITPRADIKNLKITINFLNSSNKVITSKTKVVGNVKAKSHYKLSFSLSEFTASEILTIRYWNSEITGGTVSYFYH